MDPIKKRKIDGNGVVQAADHGSFNPLMLSPDDARKILEPLTHEHLLEIVQNALLRHRDVLESVRSIADRDAAQRKLFVRGLGWETTTEKLRGLFSSYGELDEAVVILDKVTGKSKGYGFVTFKHIDGAIIALKEPSKKIDGRITVTQLAAAGISGGGGGGGKPGVGGGGVGGGGGSGGVNNPVDVSTRKIYVSNVPYEMPGERLLQHFSMYGEIEEGPLGFDKATGKSKGFALFVYKTAEAARASLVDPVKNLDGHQLNCKLASDGKRGKPSGGGSTGVHGGNQGNTDANHSIGATLPGGQYGGSGGVGGHYSGSSGSLGGGVRPRVGGPGSTPIGSQAVVNGSFGSGSGGPYAGGSHFGGPIRTGYGGLTGGGGGGLGSGAGLDGNSGGGYAGFGGSGGGGGKGGPSGGGLGGAGSGMGGAGRGSSLYGLPPGSAGMGSGEYAQNTNYSLSYGGYPGQHNQPAGAFSASRLPPGGAYQGMPPYY